MNLRLLSEAIRGERIVVNGNERVVIEIRLMVYRHQREIRHDESPRAMCGHFGWARDVTAPSRRGLGLGSSVWRQVLEGKCLKDGLRNGAEASLPVRPTGRLIGIRPMFADNAVNAGTEAAFEIAAVMSRSR